ncbi:MAG: ribonuclease HI family protein [Oligoflexia bacterium]|nr:ribonuclease HI family protein [Oligoflexia bacterium]
MKFPKEVEIYTDGASRGNPGPASIGVVIKDLEGRVVAELSERLGSQTNNFAEYTAVIHALEICQKNGVERFTLKTDSQLLVRQMTGEYKVRAEVIIPLHKRVRELMAHFSGVKFLHIPREENERADELANQALDRF